MPLSIATPEGQLRQSDKASLRNFLISKSDGVSCEYPKNAAWFVDGFAAIRSLKPKKTYKDWILSLLPFIEPPADALSCLISMINDRYLQKSIKECTRNDCGQSNVNIDIQGFEQHTLQGVRWNEFLHNGENKNGLIRSLSRFVQSVEGMKYLKYPFVISEEGKTYIVERHRSTLLHECNHEEADTRLVLHAAKQDTGVVIVSKDTDVLVLLIWAFSKHQIAYKWFFQFEREKFVEIGSICRSLGQRVCSSLPAIHAISGCDTTSYFYKAGKVKILKKLLMDESKCELIENLGASETLDEDSLEDVK